MKSEIPFKVWPQELYGRYLMNEGRKLEYGTVAIYLPNGDPFLISIGAVDLVSNDLFISPTFYPWNATPGWPEKFTKLAAEKAQGDCMESFIDRLEEI